MVMFGSKVNTEFSSVGRVKISNLTKQFSREILIKFQLKIQLFRFALKSTEINCKTDFYRQVTETAH